MIDIGFLGALLAGVLALLSPCSALLLPAFFAYAFTSQRQLLARTSLFFAGLALILVPIGIGVGGLGGVITNHRDSLITVGGWILIAIGIFTLCGFGFTIPGVASLNQKFGGPGALSVFLLGAVYGFAGFCAGPLLGAVLTTAFVGSSPWYGAVTMGLYALGMSVPLFVLALLWDRFRLGERAWLQGTSVSVGPLRLHSISMITGVLFIGMGILFLTTHGTATIPTLLSVDTQAAIQNQVAQWAASISNAATLLLVVVVIEVILLIRLLRH